MDQKWVSYGASPFGEMAIITKRAGLAALIFNGDQSVTDDLIEIESELHYLAKQQLAQYFKGEREQFSLPLALEGSPFMCEVWQILATLPYGRLISYGEIAKQIGRPKAYRAVGMALNRNPIPIILPCHRVIGSGGDLVGYAYGLSMKRALLEREGISPPWMQGDLFE